MFLLSVWIITTVAICCGCCGSPNNVRWMLHFTLFIISIGTIAVWAIGVTAFVIGGHFDIFVCRPMYDDPEFTTLHQIFDKSGVLSQNERGWFAKLLGGNDSIDVGINEFLT